MPVRIDSWDYYFRMLEEKHLLIAGATGSGKSVLENALIYTLMGKTNGNVPGGAQFVLIDPKYVELSRYKKLPHCLLYSQSPEESIQALRAMEDFMFQRFKTMEKRGERLYTGNDVYIFIDEWAALVTGDYKKEAIKLVQSISQLGRAARIHLVLLTQSPLAEIIPTKIKVNFDSRIALRVFSNRDSRNVLDMAGAETLPDPSEAGYGELIYRHSLKMERIIFEKIPDEEIDRAIKAWEEEHKQYLASKKKKSFFSRLFKIA